MKNTGFTLIELIIVVALSVMLMLTASALFMNFLLSGTKTNIEQNIKAEGSHAMAQFEFFIRNAQGLNSAYTCGSGASIIIDTIDNDTLTLGAINDAGKTKLAYTSAANGTSHLTSGGNTLSGLNFICHSGDNDSYYIEISFQLKRGPGTTPGRDTAIVDFESGVTIRN